MKTDIQILLNKAFPLTFLGKKSTINKGMQTANTLGISAKHLWNGNTDSIIPKSSNEKSTRIATSMLQTALITAPFMILIGLCLNKQLFRTAGILTGLMMISLMANLFSSTIKAIKVMISDPAEVIKESLNSKEIELNRIKGENVNGTNLAFTAAVVLGGAAVIAGLGVGKKIPSRIATGICALVITIAIGSAVLASLTERLIVSELRATGDCSNLPEDIAKGISKDLLEECLRPETNIFNTVIAEVKMNDDNKGR